MIRPAILALEFAVIASFRGSNKIREDVNDHFKKHLRESLNHGFSSFLLFLKPVSLGRTEDNKGNQMGARSSNAVTKFTIYDLNQRKGLTGF